MRTGLVVLAIWAATALAAEAAPIYPYCAHYEDRGDVTCAYQTFQQCLDTARGPAGGFCSPNPAYQPPAARSRRKAGPKRR